MGLSNQSTGIYALKEMLDIEMNPAEDIVVALAGNPNTGKSTVFNSLTGLNQHTGNWTGKTVTTAQGNYRFRDKNFVLVDLPGTYSLLSNSVEEEVARDFICFGNPSTTVVVTDATCLERNLILVLQILEITDKVVLCVNLMDEAQRKKIHIDLDKLSQILGIPVIGTIGRSGYGLEKLMDAVYKVSHNEIMTNPIKIKYDDDIERIIEDIKGKIDSSIDEEINLRWISLKLLDGDRSILNSINKYLNLELKKDLILSNNIQHEDLRDRIVSSIVKLAEDIANQVVYVEDKNYNELDRKIDNILTSKSWNSYHDCSIGDNIMDNY